MEKQAENHQHLRSGLVKLQDQGSVVLGDLRRSHEMLHRHLAALYLWWREADQEPDWLEEQYKTLDRKFRTVGYGINFGPLLWLVWGNNNGLDNRLVDRYSRAINAIHREFEQRPELYQKDGVAKLADFIKQAGGITELADYGPKTEDPSEEESTGRRGAGAGNDSQDEAASKLELVRLAKSLPDFGDKEIVSYPGYISTTGDQYGLLLVRKTDQGVDVVSRFNDPSMIDALLAKGVRQRFDASVYALRPLLELIQTQCLPISLEGMVQRLIDKTKLPEHGRKVFTAYRRVLYRPMDNEFILSPMNALSGVVSITVPYFPLILEECQHEVFLPTRERNQLEKKLLRNFAFNLYDVERKQSTIPRYPEENSASHALHLRHRTNRNDFLTLTFWPFYDTLPQPQDQVVINPDYVLTPRWKAHMGRDEFRRLNDEFLEKWLASHAQHLTRDPHALLKVTFARDHWEIQFVHRYGQFENTIRVNVYPQEASDEPCTVLFASKDWVPAIQSLAFLPVTLPAVEGQPEEDDEDSIDPDKLDIYGTFLKPFIPDEAANYKGGVSLELDEHVLRIEFDTFVFGGSRHTIYVPTVDADGNRSTLPFMRYHPQIVPDPSKLADDEDNDIEQIADEWPESKGIEP